MTQVIDTVVALREQVRAWRSAGELVGLVPTMGNLHRGHLSLVEALQSRVQRVVVSVFVNPTQFGPGEDFDAYPRTLEADREALASKGVDVVFAPPVREIYPDGPELRTRVDVPTLSDMLCGASRPGHFTGVATVVSKLFNIAQPDVAAFGKKDYQQLLVIRQMVRDLHFPLELLPVDTSREPDGLALSSRNAYLSAEERTQAPLLAQTLQGAVKRLQSGEAAARVEAWGRETLNAGGFETDYFSVRRQADLKEPQHGDRELVVLAAARLGRARLIDNVECALNRPL